MHSHIDVSHAQSQEHVIWIHYIDVWKNSCKYPDLYHYSDVNFPSTLLTFMAEVSYHIVLKYGNNVPKLLKKCIYWLATLIKLLSSQKYIYDFYFCACGVSV